MSKVWKIIIIIAFVALVAFGITVVAFFYTGKAEVAPEITWGVDFSQSQAEYLQLDWKQLYLALITDMGVKHIKLHTNWDWVEGKPEQLYFNDTDWQVQQAEQHNVKLIYVLGMKTGRWPECHTPTWVQALPSAQEKAELFYYITQVVNRYKNSPAIAYWQVENEPLFRFGECPSWYYQSPDLLKSEVALVKSLDPTHQVIISDSGEQSTWMEAAQIGDVVGITMYRKAFTNITSGIGFPTSYLFLNPETYAKKDQLIKSLYRKKVICIELQAEPWASKPLMEAPLAEQYQSMNPAMFEQNVSFAKQTGLDTFYFWGAEWWYWLKEKHNDPGIWNEAKQLFQSTT